jgi:hypothetical protein
MPTVAKASYLRCSPIEKGSIDKRFLCNIMQNEIIANAIIFLNLSEKCRIPQGSLNDFFVRIYMLDRETSCLYSEIQLR